MSLHGIVILLLELGKLGIPITRFSNFYFIFPLSFFPSAVAPEEIWEVQRYEPVGSYICNFLQIN